MLFSFSLSLHNAIGYIMARLSMTLVILLGRTVPSFRIALEMEKQEWKPFRNALDKSQRRSFDEMWDIPKLYISACSNSVQPVPLHPILISILFHHYKELTECTKQVEELMITKV